MLEAQLNIFDSIVLLVIFLSTVLAFFRGFVREVLSLGSWIGAAIITIYFSPKVIEWLKPQVSSEWVAGGVAMLGTYIVALVVLSIITSIILKYLKSGSEVGVFDNLLGMVFGFARGAFIVSLAFLLVTLMWKEDEYPEWIKGAQTRTYVEKGAMMLTSIAPNYLNDLSSLTNKAKQVGQDAAAGAQGGIEPVTPRQDGYRWMNVDSLQRMIETNVPKQPPAVPADGPQQ